MNRSAAPGARLEMVDAEIRLQVHYPWRPITDVYFPLSSIFSMVAMADERVGVEVGTIGVEGMVGLPLFLGATSSPHAAFCQVAGWAARLGADDLHQALTGDGALHRELNRFTQATMVQIAQNVVCNSTHSAEQRAARWLLTTQDRVGRDEFPLTQAVPRANARSAPPDSLRNREPAPISKPRPLQPRCYHDH